MMSGNSKERYTKDGGGDDARVARTAVISLTGEGVPIETPRDAYHSALLTLSGDSLPTRGLLNKLWSKGEIDVGETVIYENICEGCRYGIFDGQGRFCNFCQFALNGKIDSHRGDVYANLCGNCGGVCDAAGSECDQCLTVGQQPNELQAKANGELSESRGILIRDQIDKVLTIGRESRNGILRDLLGTFKKVRSRNGKLSDANKRRKLQIIHNVDVEHHYGEAASGPRITNNGQSIKLNRSYGVDSSPSKKKISQRIYGKLRKSDDHLMNSLSVERRDFLKGTELRQGNTCTNCSQSDSNIDCLGLSRGSSAAFYIAGDGDLASDKVSNGSATALASAIEASSLTAPPSFSRSQSLRSSFFMIQDNTVEWLTSLRRQTHDYCPQYAPDDSIFNVKSIPSLNFNCCGFLAARIANFVDITSAFEANPSLYREGLLSSLRVAERTEFHDAERSNTSDSSQSQLVVAANDFGVELMIDNFKRQLMEKRTRSKRRAIYVKVEDCDGTAEERCGGAISAAAATVGLVNDANRQSKRNAFHGRDSEFVNDLLTAFDTFLKRDSTANEGICDSAFDSGSSEKCEIKRTVEPAFSGPEMHGDCAGLRARQVSRCGVLLGKSEENELVHERVGPVVASLVTAKNDLRISSRRQLKSEIVRLLFRNADVFIRPSKLRNLLATIELSKSLNRRLLSIEPYLSAFLSAIEYSPQLWDLDQKKLIAMYTASAITMSTSTSPACDEPCLISNKSAIISGDKRSGEDSDDNNCANEIRAAVTPQEDIYQPIWKFRTVGNPRESYVSNEITDDIISEPGGSGSAITARNESPAPSVEDLSDWETDDEFIFSHDPSSGPRDRLLPPVSPQQCKKFIKNGKTACERGSPASSPRLGERIRALKTSLLKSNSSSQSLASFSSNYSTDSVISTSTNNSSVASHNLKRGFAAQPTYQRVCILYNHKDPRLRAIIYDCNDSQQQERLASQNNCIRNKSNSSNQLKRVSTPIFVSRPEIWASANDTMVAESSSKLIGCKSTTASKVKTSPSNDFIPLCVQAWKFTLLDINYVDDEEDMYVNRDELLNTTHRETETPPTTLKKCKSEGNLLELPPDDKKKTFGERFMNKFQAVGFFPISPRQMKDKKKLDYFKRRGSMGLYFPNPSSKTPIFGTTLEEVQLKTFTNIPEFVVDCISYIEQPEFIATDGLYRASGNKVEIDVAKKSLNERYDAKILENQDIHTITGLLKLFFRELKAALISDDIYNKLPNNLVDKENLSSIKDILYQMSPISRDTLKYLIKHLTKVAAESHTNRMPASNLAIIWGPCILYSSFTHPMSIARINTLTKVLIEQYEIIFNEKDERLIM